MPFHTQHADVEPKPYRVIIKRVNRGSLKEEQSLVQPCPLTRERCFREVIGGPPRAVKGSRKSLDTDSAMLALFILFRAMYPGDSGVLLLYGVSEF